MFQKVTSETCQQGPLPCFCFLGQEHRKMQNFYAWQVLTVIPRPGETDGEKWIRLAKFEPATLGLLVWAFYYSSAMPNIM